MLLLTQNIWFGRIARKLYPFLESDPADILCLQEVTSSNTSNPLFEFFSARQGVLEAVPLAHEYFSPTFAFDAVGREVELGNQLLSKFEITSKSTFFTNGEYLKLSHPDISAGNIRNAQIVELKTPSGRLTVVNHHGYHELDKMGSPASLEKIKLLAEELADIKGPLIIAGDFNVVSKGEAMRYLCETLNLTDLTAEYKLKDTLSPELIPFQSDCDHIFVRGGVQVNDFRLVPDLVSDHRGLILDFDIS